MISANIYEKTFSFDNAKQLSEYLSLLLKELNNVKITLAVGCGKSYDDRYVYLDQPLIMIFDNSNIVQIEYFNKNSFKITYTSIIELDLSLTGIDDNFSLINPAYFENASLVDFEVPSLNDGTFNNIKLKLSNKTIVDMSIQSNDNCCAIEFYEE